MLELLLVPAAALLYAANVEKWKKPMDDRKKIQVFFEVAGIAIKREDKLQYPKWSETKRDDLSVTYIYKLPLGMPSKVLKPLNEVIGEGLHKPVHISYKKNMLHIRVFYSDLPEKVKWSSDLLRPGTWNIAVGKSIDGWVFHDFEKLPHMVVAGTTGFGKTVFLKHLFTSLISNQPEHVRFYIVDLKNLVEFERFRHLEQVHGAAGNAEDAEVLLDAIVKEMLLMLQWMKEHFITNLSETKVKTRTFIIVDESAELAPHGRGKEAQTPLNCQKYLSQIARLGRAAGYRLVFCSQYPTGDTLPRQVKQNIVARLGFRLGDSYASDVVLDEAGLESLPEIEGRGIYKTHSKVELQTPWLKDKDMWKLLQQYEVKKDGPKPTKTETPTRDSIDD